MFILKCDQDIDKLGIRNPGGWNILAFWDHIDSCHECRKALVAFDGTLSELIVKKEEFFAAFCSCQ